MRRLENDAVTIHGTAHTFAKAASKLSVASTKLFLLPMFGRFLLHRQLAITNFRLRASTTLKFIIASYRE
jgi:hypothetical protein